MRMLRTFQSLLKASASGKPSSRLERREPARQEINMESQEARGAWLQHRRSGGEQNWNHFQADDKPGSVFAQLQPECDGRDEVVRELEHGET